MISHAIFASSHLTPPRAALSSTPPPAPRFAPHPTLHFTPNPTLHPIMRFTQHLDPHSHPYPSAKSLLPPVLPFPIRVSPSLPVPQPSPFTPYFTPHPIMPCALTPFPTTHFHRTSLLPRIPLAKTLPPRHSIFLPSTHFPSACLSILRVTQPRLRIFSCVKRPGSLTT